MRHLLAPTVLVGLMAVVVTSVAAQTPNAPTIAAGEPWIVYQGGTVAVGAGGTTPLRLVRADGTDDHLLLAADPRLPDVGHPDWSPDGEQIAFDVWTAQASGPDRLTLWTVRVDGRDAREVASCDLPCLQLAYPAWAPDGASLALARYDIREDGAWGPAAIEVLDLANGGRRTVTATADGTSAYYDPRWSPDGRFVTATLETYAAEAQGTATGSSIVVMDASGRSAAPVIVTPPDLPAAQPAWGPDDTIVFATASAVGAWPEDASLMRVRADGSGLGALMASPPAAGVEGEPSWMSDGRIMFVAASDAASRVAIVNPDGTGLQRAAWSLQVPTGSIQRAYARPRPVPSTPD